MPERDKTVDQVVLTRLIRMNATIQGVVVGTIAGLGLFVATNWLVIKGGPVVGPHLSLLNQVFIGYSVTFVGSFIGLAYGFVFGFGVGYFIAWTYNRAADWRESTRARRV